MLIRCKCRQNGVTLVEVAVAVVVMVVLTAVALPNFATYLQNLAVRNSAESLQVAMQTTRGEAIRSNNTAVLQVVDSLDNSCVASSSGKFWVVSHCSANGKCGDSIDKQNPPPAGACAEGAVRILAKGAFSNDNRVKFSLGNPVVCFSSLGRINPLAVNCPEGALDPASVASGSVTIDITHDASACQPSGDTRCLRLSLNLGGESRLCDPSIYATNDPRKCQ